MIEPPEKGAFLWAKPAENLFRFRRAQASQPALVPLQGERKALGTPPHQGCTRSIQIGERLRETVNKRIF